MRNRSVDVHKFAMIPRPDVPRSSFRMQKNLKTTFDAGLLIPIMVEEVMPGDTFNCRLTTFCRLFPATVTPVMDNIYLDTFFFFVPCRLVWDNWVRFMGQQDDPDSSTDYVVPKMNLAVAGFAPLSMGDYFGLPTAGYMTASSTFKPNVLPFRAYNLIYNEWFRDENLQDSRPVNRSSDGPDTLTDYALQRRGKRHDYFTSCLPWPQKGSPVSVPLGTSAPIKGAAIFGNTLNSPTQSNWLSSTGGSATAFWGGAAAGSAALYAKGGSVDAPTTGMYADLSQATAATINQLRQSFQIQKLLERDARGGTRYTEIINAHFGVKSPDSRLQRPEYLGGGTSAINVHQIPQTSATGVGDTPQANLAAFGTGVSSGHGFSQSFTEHGYVIGLACVRADLTYQQGMRKMWSRSTKFDFYWPAFAMLGEQAVLSREIYVDGSAGDDTVFGYQERWAELRYNPSQITGMMRSTTSGTLDMWHLAQKFDARPLLNASFIEEVPPMARVLAADEPEGGTEILMDAFFDIKAARPIPLYSVPGLIDHF